jgi:hypothetical protein
MVFALSERDWDKPESLQAVITLGMIALFVFFAIRAGLWN